MSKYRVYEVAEELGVESQQLITMLHQMDVPVRSHMSTVDETQIARLYARLERERRSQGVEVKTESRGPSRRRRRRAAPAALETAAAVESAEESEAAAVEEPAVDEADEVEAGPAEAPAAVDAAGEIEADAAEDVAGDAEVELPDGEESPPAPAAGAETGDEGVEPAAPEVAPEPETDPEAGEEPPEAEADAGEKSTTRKPKPVRRGLVSAPAASAAPGGTVRIKAEGYTVDGRRRGRREKKKQRRVDQEAVQESVKKTLAAMESGGGGRRRRRDTGPSQQEVERELREQQAEAEKTLVRVNEFLTVAELAEQLRSSPQQIITSAFKNLGLMVTINQRLDFDQIELICEEFGFEAVREEAYEAELAAIPELEQVTDGELSARAPVVTVMGHVDHGKTSLLDYIRKTNVIAGEAGGITQHIGAYQVDLDEGRSLTFLDTPGHEAFTAMRARGAELTDVVILVVAADDAVMPQTVEAISHARNAGVPIVVAINKVDLPSADVTKVKNDLLAREVILEEFGGNVLAAEVSAKTGLGIEDLLEKIVLQAELLELTATAEGEARGTVIEAELDRGMGPVATVLVQTGTLRIGDDFLCGLVAGRVRALLDERGNAVDGAGPSTPVRILGFEGVPQAGDNLIVMDPARVREIASRRQQLEREREIRRRTKGVRLEDIFAEIQAGEKATLNLVIKGDTDGSVQALSDSLERLSNEEVAVDVIHRGVGAINEGDVLLAATSAAAIIGFHVRPDTKARGMAERDGVQIRTYNVIYEAVEDIRLALEGLLKPEEREVVVGSAEVRELFRVPKAGTVAGCFVVSGTMQRNLPIRLLRDFVQVYEGKIGSLRRFKEDVREVRDGYECGISIDGFNDVKVGDVIECYRIEEVARTLAEPGATGGAS
ncbi:MAG: translation initiation factor IF-2 [Gemmatimonadota bacterium]